MTQGNRMRVYVCMVGGGATGALSSYFGYDAKADIFCAIIIKIYFT